LVQVTRTGGEFLGLVKSSRRLHAALAATAIDTLRQRLTLPYRPNDRDDLLARFASIGAIALKTRDWSKSLKNRTLSGSSSSARSTPNSRRSASVNLAGRVFH
jgi:hypothetical protein